MTDKQPSEQDAAPVLDSTLEEHEHCMRLVSALSSWLEGASQTDDDWVGTLRTHLAAVSQSLRDHFEGEERSALYCEVPIEVPRYAARLDKLKAEHRPMLSDINDIIETTDQLEDPKPEVFRELRARLNLLIATLRRHEAEENEIIMSAYWDDIGVTD